MKEQVQKEQENREKEIDLIALIKRLWHKRKFIIWVTLSFMVLGLLVALFSKKQYTAGCLFVPQVSQKGVSGSMSSLAALAGINLKNMSSSEALSPMIYPQILNNVDFRKELMYSKFKFKKWDKPVSLIDYYTNPDYSDLSVMGYIVKYTIGLPFVILDAIRDKDTLIAGEGTSLKYLSEDEFKCGKVLSKKLNVNVNEKQGYLELSVIMPEPVVAAEVAEKAFDLLEKYVTEFKIEKARETLEYVDARLEETKKDFEEKQLAYAKFQDANRVISSATARIKDEELRREYELVNTIYTELARQKVQTELQVKEDTPVLSVVKPVVVPTKKTKPKRLTILVGFTFFGFLLSCGLVFGFDYLRNRGSYWPRRWKTEEEEKEKELSMNA